MRARAWALAGLLAAVAQAAPAATYYVRTSGSDGNSGLSPAQAWRTIQHAGDAVEEGDTVYIGAGTYTDSVSVQESGSSGSPIRFIADTAGTFTGDAGAVVLSAGGNAFFIDEEDHIHVTGLRVTGGSDGFDIRDAVGIRLEDCEVDGLSDDGIEVNGADVEIVNCDVHDNGDDGVRIDGSGSDVIFRGGAVRDNGDMGILLNSSSSSLELRACDVQRNGDEGLYINYGSALVVNCLIYENTSHGIELRNDGSQLTLWHSTLEDNGNDGVYQRRGTSTIRNSILASNDGDGLDRDAGTMTHTHNLVWGSGSQNWEGTSAATGEISANPLFVGGGDYHLQASSPAVDAGTDASSVTSQDKDGVARPGGSGWDMGAYEGVSGPNLVLHWMFDDGAGQTATDDSGNGLDGTLGGGAGAQASDPAWTTGITNCSALEFDGSDDYVEIADTGLLDMPSTVTVASWINPDVIPTGGGLRSILSKDENYEYHVRAGGEIHYWWTDSGGSAHFINTTGAGITTGNWHHVAVTYSPGEQKVYVDGVEVGSASHGGSLMTNGDPVHVGQDQFFGGRFFDGVIDDVRIYASVLSQADILAIIAEGAPCGADHFQVSHDGSGVNCQAENVTITAHDAAHSVATSYTGTINLSTSTGNGDWSLVTGAGTLVNGGGGSATYTYAGADAGEVVLGLLDTFAETVNVDVSDGASSEDPSEDPDLVFLDAGFSFLANGVAGAVGLQIGGKPSNAAPGAQALELEAIRTSDSTGACEAALTGVNPVEMAFTCEEPATCAGAQVSVNGTPVPGSPAVGPGTWAPVDLDFGSDTDTTAPLVVTYPDVGRIQLHARYALTPSGELLTGASNEFVVRPFAFEISVPGNPGGATPGGGFFTEAGADFAANARAVLWHGADDLDADGVADGHANADPLDNANLADNGSAVSYGREAAVEGVLLGAALAQPGGGTDPGLQGTTTIATLASGTGSTSAVYFDEVGAIELSAQVPDGDYLGIGAVDTAAIAGRSGHVGRFRPAYFDVTEDTAPVLATACTSFTYVGQHFVYATAPVVRVTARSTRGTQTRNYAGAWWKITNGSLANRDYLADPGHPVGLDESDLPAPADDPAIVDQGNGITTLTFSLGTGLRFDRAGPTPAFDAEIALSIDVLDLEGVAYTGNPYRIAAPSSGNGMAWSSGAAQRYGRLALTNAFGSELGALPVPMRAEYWTGSGFALHGDDGCTLLTAANVGTTARSPGSLATAPTVANAPLLSGDAGLSFSAPGSEGSADVLVNLGSTDVATPWGPIVAAGMPWLRWDWSGDGAGPTYDEDPTARIDFGIFGGDAPVIFRREIY